MKILPCCCPRIFNIATKKNFFSSPKIGEKREKRESFLINQIKCKLQRLSPRDFFPLSQQMRLKIKKNIFFVVAENIGSSFIKKKKGKTCIFVKIKQIKNWMNKRLSYSNNKKKKLFLFWVKVNILFFRFLCLFVETELNFWMIPGLSKHSNEIHRETFFFSFPLSNASFSLFSLLLFLVLSVLNNLRVA